MPLHKYRTSKAVSVVVGGLITALCFTLSPVSASADTLHQSQDSIQPKGPKFRCPTKSISRDFASTHTFLTPDIGTYGVGYRVGFSGIICTRGSVVVRYLLDPITVSYEDSVISRIESEKSTVKRKAIKQYALGKGASIQSIHELLVETGLPEICIPLPTGGEVCTPALNDKIKLVWNLETRVIYNKELDQLFVFHYPSLV